MKSYAFRWFALLALIVTVFAAGVSPARAATVPTGFVDGGFGGSLSSATAMAFAPDGRLFVLQQTGEVKVIKNGALLGTNFHALTVDSSGERGLLGIAFDPNFATNQYVYLYYTVPTGSIHNRVIRVTANGDVSLGGSQITLIDLENLTGATNHNGGAMHFRADGKLYVAVGDNATSSNAQTLNNRLGKILRYNTDGTIPTDNPFYDTATGANRSIWALGLRNPYTFAIQSTTDRMFINDVGQSTWEEINDGSASTGINFGWPTTEGATTNTSFRTPYYYYAHSGAAPTGCAITGGAFYNPATVQFPTSYVGKYFFADYCSGWIYYIDPTLAAPTNANPTAIQTPTSFATGASSPVDLQVGPDGALYYLQRSGVRRVTYPAGQVAPTIAQHPANQTVSVGQTATFTVSANGTPPLGYQWQRNTVDIPGANSSSYTTPATVIGDNGALYRCVVTNAFGSATSNAATLTVTNRTPPTVNITSPADSTLFSGGQQFTYSGTATDTVDGTLPASAYSWSIVLHHASHTHPILGPITGVTSGNFTVPNSGHTETNIFYRITLTATNTASLSASASVDLDPTLINITVNSTRFNIPFTGASITVDGQPFTTSNTFQSVAGVQRTIGTGTVQYTNGHWYGFYLWSDSGAATHIVAPTADTTYTVRYAGRAPGIGVYRNGVFYLRNQLSSGAANTIFAFGQTGWTPVAGDWNGDGVDSIGVYNPATSVFYLRNTNSAGAADYVFAFGNPNDTPIVGRWDNTMNNSGVGVYRQSNGLIYLKRTLAGGFSDHWMVFGSPGDKPIAGDWDGTGFDSPGILRPGNNVFYLTDSTDGVVNSDYNFTTSTALGSGLPIAADWGTDVVADRVGAFLNGQFYYSYDLGGGNLFAVTYGAAGDLPVTGYWIAPSAPAPQSQPAILVLPGNGKPALTNPDGVDSAD